MQRFSRVARWWEHHGFWLLFTGENQGRKTTWNGEQLKHIYKLVLMSTEIERNPRILDKTKVL